MSTMTPPINPSIPLSTPVDQTDPEGSMLGRTVRWFREPGDYHILRTILGVSTAILLSITIVGLPIVYLAYQEWQRQDRLDIARMEQEDVQELSRKVEEFAANWQTRLENSIRTNESNIQNLRIPTQEGRYDFSTHNSLSDLSTFTLHFQRYISLVNHELSMSKNRAESIETHYTPLRQSPLITISETFTQRMNTVMEQYNLFKERGMRLVSTSQTAIEQIQRRRQEILDHQEQIRRNESLAASAAAGRIQQVVQALPGKMDLFTNQLTAMEDFIRSGEAILDRLRAPSPRENFNLFHYTDEELQQFDAALTNSLRSGIEIVDRATEQQESIRADFTSLTQANASLTLRLRFTRLKEQYNELEEQCNTLRIHIRLKLDQIHSRLQLASNQFRAGVDAIQQDQVYEGARIIELTQEEIADLEREAAPRRVRDTERVSHILDEAEGRLHPFMPVSGY